MHGAGALQVPSDPSTLPAGQTGAKPADDEPVVAVAVA
jgi:hypothetical protein